MRASLAIRLLEAQHQTKPNKQQHKQITDTRYIIQDKILLPFTLAHKMMFVEADQDHFTMSSTDFISGKF